MKVKLVIEYRGDDYCGFQTQPKLPTVQAELEQALRIFFSAEYKKEGREFTGPAYVSGSGRTDSGVHAYGQVVTVVWPELREISRHRLQVALNGILPEGIGVVGVEFLPDEFDARRSAHSKCYQYRLLLRKTKPVLHYNRAWCVSPDLDLTAMIVAARCFIGEHDFTNFCAKDCDAVSKKRIVLRSELTRLDREELCYQICGQGFLKQMVRIIVGSLVAVGEGRLTPGDLEQLLEGTAERARFYIKTAPAYGLYLKEVYYRS